MPSCFGFPDRGQSRMHLGQGDLAASSVPWQLPRAVEGARAPVGGIMPHLRDKISVKDKIYGIYWGELLNPQ